MSSTEISTDQIITGMIFGNRYKIVEKIGCGKYGDVFLASHVDTENEFFAIKVESVSAEYRKLTHEWNIYKSLHGGVGIPKVLWYGKHEGKYNVMSMERLGPSLCDLHKDCKRRFSLKTVLMLADQLLTRIEFVHSRGVIHQDIKPGNLLMGLGRHSNQLYLIDFGLSKEYVDSHSRQHIAFVSGHNFVGTPLYSSIRANRGDEQSRRDDLESIGYLLIFFLLGYLPWQKQPSGTLMEKLDKITQFKLETSVETLCKGLPVEFANYLKYCRRLGFKEEPNYNYLRQLFRSLFEVRGYKQDSIYDWMGKGKKKSGSSHGETCKCK